MTDLLRLEVLMDYQVTARGGSGIAAVRWQPLTESAALPGDRSRIALAALHYGRILSVHGESREELFRRVGLAAHDLAEGAAEAQFEPWPLQIGGTSFDIWPWYLVEPAQLKPRTYTSTLKDEGRGHLSVWLKMAWGLENVLAPASALLAISALALELDAKDRIVLGHTLVAMNDYYGTPDQAAGAGKEVHAFDAAIPLLFPALASAREAAAEVGRARREAAFQQGKREGSFLGYWGAAGAMALAIGGIVAGLGVLVSALGHFELPLGLLGFWLMASLLAFVFVYRRVRRGASK
jgi:hypothetical protein